MAKKMFRIVIECDDVPAASGEEAATDIANEFAEHRKWYANVRCVFDGSKLSLEAESDVDDDGQALSDEFADCIAAYISKAFDGDLKVISVVTV